MSYASIANQYQSERRMIQFRARIWKRVHKDPEYRSWMLNSKDGPVTKQVRLQKKDEGHGQPADRSFCHKFLQLPGEIRNQIYDELLRQRESSVGFTDQTPLFRSIDVTKRSHGAATYTGQTALPMNRFSALKWIGSNKTIWNEIFSRWSSTTTFQLTEAFELESKTPSLRQRIFSRHQQPHGLAFSRYTSDETSRVFDHSAPWFPLMRSCALTMHVFNIADPLFRDGALFQTRLHAAMHEVADVLSRVNNLEELDVDMFLWPDRYQPSSSLASWQGQNPPNEAKVWDAIEPLKRVQGIRKIVLHAGAEVHEEWSRLHAAIETQT